MQLSVALVGLAGWRSRLLPVLVVLIVGGGYLVDGIWLRGERVTHGRARLDAEEPFVFEVDRPGEPYLLEVGTRRRTRGESRGRKVALRLEGPDGTVLEESAELRSHTRRFLSFEPRGPGRYALFVADAGVLFQNQRAHADVEVFVGDRRVFERLFAWF